MPDPADLLDLMFRNARSQNGWTDAEVPDETLQAAYALAACGPTSLNSQPMRVLFLRSAKAKERLRPALGASNVDKTLTAPVVAIIAHDVEFHRHMARNFPEQVKLVPMFEANQSLAEVTAFRNATLQAGYFLLAARAVGLDCGPMSGFDNGKVDAEFYAGTSLRSNFLCGLGRGDPAKLSARHRRFAFGEVCQVL